MIEGLEELLSLDADIDLEQQMRQIGIERASRNAGDEWFMEAMHVVQEYLTKHVALLADDLWDEGLLIEPCNTRRALGGVVRKAADLNWIETIHWTFHGIVLTGSRQSIHNGQQKTVWKSNLYGQEPVSIHWADVLDF